MSRVLYPADVVDYPDSDGRPMAESDFQREPLMYAVESLRIHFRDRPDVYARARFDPLGDLGGRCRVTELTDIAPVGAEQIHTGAVVDVVAIAGAPGSVTFS
jgi:hypothetical protein